MVADDDVVNFWDNAGVNTVCGGSGLDTLDFRNWQSQSGVTVDFVVGGGGFFRHFNGATTGTFEGFEFVAGTTFGDTMNASDASSGAALSGEGAERFFLVQKRWPSLFG